LDAALSFLGNGRRKPCSARCASTQPDEQIIHGLDFAKRQGIRLRGETEREVALFDVAAAQLSRQRGRLSDTDLRERTDDALVEVVVLAEAFGRKVEHREVVRDAVAQAIERDVEAASTAAGSNSRQLDRDAVFSDEPVIFLERQRARPRDVVQERPRLGELSLNGRDVERLPDDRLVHLVDPSTLVARAVPVKVRGQAVARVLGRVVELSPPRGDEPEALEAERRVQPADAGAPGEEVLVEREADAIYAAPSRFVEGAPEIHHRLHEAVLVLLACGIEVPAR